MTVKTLLDDVMVQGNVRVSTWENDEERVICTYDDIDYLPAGNLLLKKWLDAEVLYMFCPGDGFLHIEIESEV